MKRALQSTARPFFVLINAQIQCLGQKLQHSDAGVGVAVLVQGRAEDSQAEGVGGGGQDAAADAGFGREADPEGKLAAVVVGPA